MFIPRHGGRSVPAPVPSPAETANEEEEQAEEEERDATRARISEAGERVLNLALDDDAPLGDADDCVYLSLSAAGMTEIDPLTGAEAVARATTGAGTVGDPLYVPFTGDGIFLPGPMHSAGAFYNRVGYGSPRWLPVDPGRPIQASQGKLSLAVSTMGGSITPAGVLVLQYYRRPKGISWGRWMKRAQESGHGYAIAPGGIPTTVTGVVPTGTSVVAVEIDGTPQTYVPPAGTLYTIVTLYDAGTTCAVGTDASQPLNIGPAAQLSSWEHYGTGTIHFQGVNGQQIIFSNYS
jgi:hypothetical protein